MSIEETRQLGIEFERRVQTMIPETEFFRKLDTETIYSFLNQYQDKYINDIYRNLDRVPSGTKLSAHIEKILQKMLQRVKIKDDSIVEYTGSSWLDSLKWRVYKLPNDFGMYINSLSETTSSFGFKQKFEYDRFKVGILANKLISQNDVDQFFGNKYDNLRILRTPVVTLNMFDGDTPTIKVIHDRYTTVVGLILQYYKKPAYFDIMNSTPCELPIEAFDDIVTGAVELYVQYVAGAEAKRRQQQEAAQRTAREDQRDSRRSGGNQDVQS